MLLDPFLFSTFLTESPSISDFSRKINDIKGKSFQPSIAHSFLPSFLPSSLSPSRALFLPPLLPFFFHSFVPPSTIFINQSRFPSFFRCLFSNVIYSVARSSWFPFFLSNFLYTPFQPSSLTIPFQISLSKQTFFSAILRALWLSIL